MNFETLTTSLEENILIVTINRPDKLNALNKKVLNELSAVVDEVNNNAAIKSAIVTGSGEKSFVAGADIKEFVGLTPEEGKAFAQLGQDVFFKIENAAKPIVACVNGFALGGGCELAMACHFRLASANAKFGQPEVNLGLLPGFGGTQRLTQLIGKGRAIEMMISTKMIDADTALNYGLTNYVTTAEELLPTAKSILKAVNTKAPLAVAKCIAAANAVYKEDVNGYDAELQYFSECFVTDDMKEGTSAFLEKRKAVFAGK